YGSRQGYAQSPPPSDLTAQLLDRVQTLEEQVRRLRGQLDEVTNETQRQTAEMAKQIGDLNFQLQRGGPPQAGAPPAAMSSPPGPLSRQGAGPPERRAATAPRAAPARRTPELALQEAHTSLARRDYSAAEAAAREVLQGSRTSPRAYDAQFLLAQALAGQRNH